MKTRRGKKKGSDMCICDKTNTCEFKGCYHYGKHKKSDNCEPDKKCVMNGGVCYES